MIKNGKPIDQGIVDRVAGKVSYASSGGAASWFPPLQPLPVVAPKDSPARALDYPTGFNLLLNPRSDEVVTYSQMRFVYENVSLVTLAVETRKDQIAKQGWDIRLKADAGEGLDAKKRKELAKNDPRIKEIRDLLKKPDKQVSWGAWIRKLIHEVLVTDAPAIYVRRNVLGGVHSLLQLDGTTITRKINLDGTTPVPGQVFEGGVTVDPNDGAPSDTAYQQIIKGAPYVNYTTDELIFCPRNQRVHKLYGYSPVEQIIFTANIVLRRDMLKMNTYTEGNMPPALASMDSDWTPEQIVELQQKFDAINQGDLAATRRLQFVPKINALHLLKQDALKDDADEWFARLILYAFSLPPTALTKQMNRSTAEQAEESALDEGLVPLMNWVKDLINDIISHWFGYEDIEFVWQDGKVIDPKVQAETHSANIKSGVQSRNEAREALGLDPIEGGDVYTIETSNGCIPLTEAVMSTKDKIANGLMADPTIPKPSPFGGDPSGGEDLKPGEKPAGEPKVSPDKLDAKKTLRNELAKQYNEIYEDLNPELRDPVIVAKLLELERGVK